MPAKKNNRSKGTRKQRKGRNRGGMVGVSKAPTAFPSMHTCTMRYNAVVALAPAAGSVATNVFRLNSVFDPDYTGVGATVAGYTSLAALYGKYRVLGFSMKIEYMNYGAAPLTCFVAVNPVTTVGVDITAILRQRHVWYRGICSKDGSGTITHVVRGSVSSVYGVPRAQVRSEDDYASVTGSNPNNPVFAHVGVYADGAAAGTANAHVSIDFNVVWSLPLEVSP